MVIVEQPRAAELGIIFFVHYVLLLEKHRLFGYYVFIVFFQNGFGHLFYMLFHCVRDIIMLYMCMVMIVHVFHAKIDLTLYM